MDYFFSVRYSNRRCNRNLLLNYFDFPFDFDFENFCKGTNFIFKTINGVFVKILRKSQKTIQFQKKWYLCKKFFIFKNKY